MTGTRLPDERAQAVRSLGSLLNYVRLDPRKGLKRVLHVLGKEILISYLSKYMSCTYDPGKIDLRSNPFQEGRNDASLGSAPGKTEMHGLIIGSSKDICSLFDSCLPNHEASRHEITWRMFSTNCGASRR
uniref:Uncharacterized protein n=1 Tax=Brassica oleracea var. oleracea TaxID=109376 RepID=A0A0D3D4A0_BRAOL